MKINLLKNDIKIRYKCTTQPIGQTQLNYRPIRYWEKSSELIDRLKLVREVKSTALDGKLFQISITRSEKNDDLAVHEQ